MEKQRGRLPKTEGEYVIETKSGKHIAYYNKTTKKFLWDMNSPIGCSIKSAKTITWWKQ